MATKREGTSSRATAAAPKPKDFVAIADRYAHEAIADKRGRRSGKLLRQAAQRYLADRKRAAGKRPPFVFDPWHANDACDFIEKLPHVEGKWETPDIQLHPSHVFFVVQLFGFRKHDGSRRFTSALFAVARKNAKSTLAAAILLYCLCCEDESGAQIISAATTFPQASIIFNIAKMMAQKCADLRDAFGLALWAKAITRLAIGANFRAIHAKASTQDGLNPSHVSLDEIHAHKTADLVNVLTSAAGARSNPLWLYTTTEGYTNAGPWGELRQFAKQLLQGLFKHDADHFLVVFFAVDDDDKDFDADTWIKANPLADANPHLLAAIRKEAVEAQRMPSKLAEFRIKRLNRPASVAGGWVLLTKWQRCGGAVDLAALRGVPCWGGLDLSSTTDITAFRLVWWVDGKLLTWGIRWVPENAVAQRTERGTVPYAGWVESGLIRQTAGDVVDYDVIERDIREVLKQVNLQQLAFDRWNAQDLCNRLVNDGVPMIEFVQGPKSYHPAMQALERAYLAGDLAHGGDPVLTWCAANLVARQDVNLNMAPDKRRSTEKIDDMCALLMAVGVSKAPAESEAIEQGFVVMN